MEKIGNSKKGVVKATHWRVVGESFFFFNGDHWSDKDLKGRRMRIAQIYACVQLYFLLKAAAFDVPS